MKLLIVDDCVDIVNILSSFLELSGHEIDKALDGIEAAELLRSNSYDVVITDAEMPRMGGAELCRFIKSDFPATYVIGMSGSFQALNDFKAAGSDICFAKPFHLDEMENAVENIWSSGRSGSGVADESFWSYPERLSSL
jgi:DNA-binding response OmpR family regulator